MRAVLITGGGAAFYGHVVEIVLVSSEEQVRRIDTGSYVAMMTNKHSFVNRTVREYKGETVCTNGLTRMERKPPIAIGVYESCPKPASVRACRLVNVFPEAGLWRDDLVDIPAVLGTAQPFPFSYLVGLYGEVLATMFTDAVDHDVSHKRRPSLLGGFLLKGPHGSREGHEKARRNMFFASLQQRQYSLSERESQGGA